MSPGRHRQQVGTRTMPLRPMVPYWQTTDRFTAHLYLGDVLGNLRRMPADTYHSVITSPPYWALRDYGTAQWEGGDPSCGHAPRAQVAGSKTSTNVGQMRDKPSQVCKCGAKRIDAQLGSEECPDCLGWARGVNCAEQDWQSACHVCRIALVFREVRRVLRFDGTLWLNYGDTYNANTGAGFNTWAERGTVNHRRLEAAAVATPLSRIYLPPGNLVGIPWRVAFALQADGWLFRSDIPWVKRNAMPESCTNRPAKSLEYVFLFSRQQTYYFDMNAVKPTSSTVWNSAEDFATPIRKAEGLPDKLIQKQRTRYTSHLTQHPDGERTTRNMRNSDLWFQSVRSRERSEASIEEPYGMVGVEHEEGWTEIVGLDIPAKGIKAKHYATFPDTLITPMIKAGTSEYGCCAKCGKQWERIVSEATGGSKGWSWHDHSADEITGNFKVESSKGYKPGDTVGWQPTCTCHGCFVERKVKRKVKRRTEVDDSRDRSLEKNRNGTGASTLDPHKEVIEIEVDATVYDYKPYIPLDQHPVIPCVVLDPFVGSGTTVKVATSLGRRGAGIELSQQYLDKFAIPRIEGAMMSRPATKVLVPYEHEEREPLDLGESIMEGDGS